MRVLMSVNNISGYLISELRELVQYSDITVVEFPCEQISKLDLAEKIHWLDRRKLSKEDIRKLSDEHFDVFLCGGWADRVMVSLAYRLRRQGVKTVLLIDTPWQCRMKQVLHCVISRFYLTQTFDYAWGAGLPQKQYLRYLGFAKDRIRIGYYCADTKRFSTIGEDRINRASVSQLWPHIFLYIGRYVPVKNLHRMELAFLEALKQRPQSDWRLICIGDGVLWNERTIHPRIDHLGYKPPHEIQNFVRKAGCFVLPSVYEPWGVVVHEAVLMGLPLLCSNQIQAATAYLKVDMNGFCFNPFDTVDIASSFVKIMDLSNVELMEMGRSSFRFGMSYQTKDWVKIVQEFAS